MVLLAGALIAVVTLSSSVNGFTSRVPYYYIKNGFPVSSSLLSSKTTSTILPKKTTTRTTALQAVPIIVTGNNIELTDSLEDYVNKKLERTMIKLESSGVIKDCDVHLSVNKNPKVKNSHKAEVVTSLKGTIIRCAEETPDMYASIDAVTDRLARKLRKYKERRLDGYHGGPHIGDNFASVMDAIEAAAEEAEASTTTNDNVNGDFVDSYAPTITKIKSYDLSKPISLQEAVFALDYVDHDFYVFRNEESNEINVVYKRNEGSVGLIEPK